MNDTLNRFADVITVDGFNRYGKLDTIRLAKPQRSRLVALRRLQEERAQTIRNTFNMPTPMGMTASEYRVSQVRTLCRQNLPPITDCDFDIGPGAGFGPDFAGEIPWLVGGNDDTQLPEVPEDGFFDLGIDVPLPLDPIAEPELAALANAGIDFITTGEERIRIFGAATDEEPEYQECMEGRVIIANGFIETEDCPAEIVIIPATVPGAPGAPAALGAIADLYLERPSNAYNLLIEAGDLGSLLFIPAGFPVTLFADDLVEFGGPDVNPEDPFTIEAYTAFFTAATEDPNSDAGIALAELIAATAAAGVPISSVLVFLPTILPFLSAGVVPGDAGVAILLLANIFLGDAPLVNPTSVATFNPNGVNVQPNPLGIGSQLYEAMGLDSFNYLLNLINESGVDIALFVGLPAGVPIGGVAPDDLEAENSDIYSNANAGGAGFFLIPAGGAGFFEMRVDGGIAHVMLSNVEYDNYVEPETTV